MRKPGLFVAILALVVLLPPDARSAALQIDPVGGQPVDPNYGDQAERQRQDRRRQEQDERNAADPCELGSCGDFEGLQSRGIPDTRIVAVLHRVELDDDVLTVRLRFHNDGAEPARISIDPTNPENAFLLRVGEEEHGILRNGDGELEAKDPLEVEIKPGKMETWWAKFPAPPAGTRRFDLEIPPVATFRDVRLDD
jgi:hypothetical protein